MSCVGRAADASCQSCPERTAAVSMCGITRNRKLLWMKQNQLNHFSCPLLTATHACNTPFVIIIFLCPMKCTGCCSAVNI
ncbi:hypothetical protein GN956_G12558 [Arapaima gigas]